MSDDNGSKCAVCFAKKDEEIVTCSRCNLRIHGRCYGCSFTTNKSRDGWKCRYCHAIMTGKAKNYKDNNIKAIKCRICNLYKFGALKLCEKGQGFAHLVCAKWTPFICIGSEYNQAPIKGIEKCDQLKSALNKLYCDICKKNHATTKCRMNNCNKFYHPLCLIEKNRNCMIESNGKIENISTKIHYTYCPQHVQFHKVCFTLCLCMYRYLLF